MITRLLARVVVGRLRMWAQTLGLISEIQFSQPGRSAVDEIYILRTLREHAVRAPYFQLRLDLLDLEKAFPFTVREGCWELLEAFGCGPSSGNQGPDLQDTPGFP